MTGSSTLGSDAPPGGSIAQRVTVPAHGTFDPVSARTTASPGTASEAATLWDRIGMPCTGAIAAIQATSLNHPAGARVGGEGAKQEGVGPTGQDRDAASVRANPTRPASAADHFAKATSSGTSAG